jgi:putative NIF3 family GTP cyclohydrolase 1 type 2
MQKGGVDLAIAHHPLIFPTVRAIKGEGSASEALLTLARGGQSFIAAHTNWDKSPVGINFALAEQLGLRNSSPILDPVGEATKVIVTYVPISHAEEVLNAMSSAGAGQIGLYERCAFSSMGTGTFKPLEGSSPFIGERGVPQQVDELRLEMVCEPALVNRVIEAHNKVHPYEEPLLLCFDASRPSASTCGFLGQTQRLTAAEFASHSSKELGGPVRVFGDREQWVDQVMVVGGSASKMWKVGWEAGVKAFLTGEVRHEQAVEAIANGMVLFEAGHEETETPGMKHMAYLLQTRMQGAKVEFYGKH